MFALRRFAPRRFVFHKNARARNACPRSACSRLASSKRASRRSASANPACVKSAPEKSALLRSAPWRFALLSDAPRSAASFKSGFSAGCVSRQLFHASTPCRRTETCSSFGILSSRHAWCAVAPRSVQREDEEIARVLQLVELHRMQVPSAGLHRQILLWPDGVGYRRAFERRADVEAPQLLERLVVVGDHPSVLQRAEEHATRR